ncbi:CPBP family intramembrane glutamic endopeptidase [Halopelagius longus]|uniref:CPBP family intramembrane glutamic endopeptidase n=1 Tax=Halopelagius longus TaxID=1236180 RepID=UPI001C31B97B|nr:CPBP family intramembrane glutamic endopeptidase [Halopelagius longus]
MAPPYVDATGERDAFERPTVVGLVVALLGIPALSFAARTLSVGLHPVAEIALLWSLLGVVLGVVFVWEDRPLRSLGVRRPDRIDAAYLLAATVLGFLALAATGPLVEMLGLAQSGQTGMGVEEYGVGIAVAAAVTTGVVEEVLYRGYAIERLAERSESALVAGGLSWAAFTVAHAVSWQLGDLLQVALAALVFTLVYVRRRSLFAVVGAHVLIWLLGVLGAVYG